ncbi:glycosyltransferase family 4 protein [Euzebya tangerina]|uniref:glycosyltransferase family 4 protein n=1 Tax=Euzebya tangerina TaxID=591198 RepID=UPI000E3236D5|nr:MraY family glycosyltransferase [Euzebya tangerina]
MSDWLLYAGIFTVAVALSLLAVPLAIRFAASRQVVDRPGGYKLQEAAVPYLGGVAIVSSFVVVAVAAMVIRPPIGGDVRDIAIILGLAVTLSLMGLIDDLKGLGPVLRLVIQVGAAVTLLLATTTGVRLFDSGGVIDAAITVVWIVGITNAFNLLDNMDGLSGGITAIASLAFFVIAALSNQYLIASMSIALAGCALGFLAYNWHPARIYMGDAGSLFLGFMLAVLGLRLRFAAPREVTAFVPVVVLALPVLDTALVTVSRMLHGRNPLAGGRDHMSHRLVFVGLSVPNAVRTMYLVAITLGWTGLIMSRVDTVTAFLTLGLVAAGMALFGFLLGRVPVYSNSKREKVVVTTVEKVPEDYEHEEEDVAAAADAEETTAAAAYVTTDQSAQ